MKTAYTHVEVWLEPQEAVQHPKWCVSLCDEDGDEIRCLSAHDEKSEAEAAAKKARAAIARATGGEK